MPQSDEERTTQPSMLVRADEIQQQIQQLSGRDFQLGDDACVDPDFASVWYAIGGTCDTEGRICDANVAT